MKIDDKKCVDINNMCSNLLEKVRKLLPAYYSIPRLDTTSYPFGVGKNKPFKKGLKKDKIGRFQCFQIEKNKAMKPVEKFVQTSNILEKKTNQLPRQDLECIRNKNRV